jgi:transposase
MRKIKEILRLKWDCGFGDRQIARSCGIARSTVGEYLRRASMAKLSWPLPEELTEARIEQLLFPPLPAIPAAERPLPIWADVHFELRSQKNVTLALLWEEYREQSQNGYQYSRYCDLYRAWTGKLHLWMRQEHKAGEKTFVDYCGQTVPINDPTAGAVREAQVFVAVLGASNYAYAEATWTQSLPDWINAHVRAFSFFHGVTELVCHDNLKNGVTRPCRYEPEGNQTYLNMLAHYGTASLPGRVRHPRDQAKVEAGVQIVQRWILARLRNRKFFSLAELNAEIGRLLENLNQRAFKKLPGSRRSQFETLDRPALKPLPLEPYVYSEWLKATVQLNYHIEVERHFYSVPYQLYKQVLEVRLTAQTVECLHKGQRVASHRRSFVPFKYTTVTEHMPPAHRHHAEWTPERLARWARQSGPLTVKLVEAIMESRLHPQQGFRACVGVMRLGKVYSAERLEAACGRALRLDAISYKSIKSILKSGLDRQPVPVSTPPAPPINHPNIRGSEYFLGGGSC